MKTRTCKYKIPVNIRTLPHVFYSLFCTYKPQLLPCNIPVAQRHSNQRKAEITKPFRPTVSHSHRNWEAKSAFYTPSLNIAWPFFSSLTLHRWSHTSRKELKECLYTMYIKDTKKTGPANQMASYSFAKEQKENILQNPAEVSPQMQEDPVNMITSGKKEFPSCSCFLLWKNNP